MSSSIHIEAGDLYSCRVGRIRYNANFNTYPRLGERLSSVTRCHLQAENDDSDYRILSWNTCNNIGTS